MKNSSVFLIEKWEWIVAIDETHVLHDLNCASSWGIYHVELSLLYVYLNTNTWVCYMYTRISFFCVMEFYL